MRYSAASKWQMYSIKQKLVLGDDHKKVCAVSLSEVKYICKVANERNTRNAA
jgi:hypothetical protein